MDRLSEHLAGAQVSETSRDRVRRAKAQLGDLLRNVSGITSVGIGKARLTGDYIVQVTVRDEAAAKRVPDTCEGVAVEVSVTGEFEAY